MVVVVLGGEWLVEMMILLLVLDDDFVVGFGEKISFIVVFVIFSCFSFD